VGALIKSVGIGRSSLLPDATSESLCTYRAAVVEILAIGSRPSPAIARLTA
jgi:hypothetical protein